MHTDLVYETLHPFHAWAWIAAVCAFTTAVAACAVLDLSQRLTKRWWLGMGILAVCLLIVAFGARSRGAAYDLRSIAVACYKPPAMSGCEVWAPQVVAARQRVEILGISILAATALSLIAATTALFLRRHPDVGPRLPASALPIAAAIFVAGCGTYLTADGIAHWIETAYLADITRAGDGLGQIPLEEAIMSTIFGVLVLAASLGVLIASSMPGRRPAIANPQSSL
jgi:hypothetical protein